MLPGLCLANSQPMNQPQHDMPDPSKGKQGIEHVALLRSDVVDANGQEVIVWDTEYAPRAINPRHYHPSASPSISSPAQAHGRGGKGAGGVKTGRKLVRACGHNPLESKSQREAALSGVHCRSKGQIAADSTSTGNQLRKTWAIARFRAVRSYVRSVF
jgi:hypothetical protein